MKRVDRHAPPAEAGGREWLSLLQPAFSRRASRRLLQQVVVVYSPILLLYRFQFLVTSASERYLS